MYCKISNIRHTKTQNLNDSHLVLQTFVFAQSIEARCLVENEDVVGAAPTGDAATTYEWLTVLLPMNVPYIRGLTVPPSSPGRVRWRGAVTDEPTPGPCFNVKTVFPGMRIPMLKIDSYETVLSLTGIPILVRRHLLLTRPPGIHGHQKAQALHGCFLTT